MRNKLALVSLLHSVVVNLNKKYIAIVLLCSLIYNRNYSMWVDLGKHLSNESYIFKWQKL